MARTRKRRLPEFDAARCIAVIAIIVYHTGIIFSERFYRGAGTPLDVVRLMDTFHLYALFIISGYFTDFSRRLSAGYAGKLARTLLVPYAAACLLTIAGAVICQLILGGDPGKEALEWFQASLWGAGNGSDVALVQVRRIGGIWFLLALFWAKLAVALIAGVRDRRARAAIYLGLFIASVVSAQHVWLPWSIQSGVGAVFIMYLGRLLRDHGAFVEENRWGFAAGSAICWLLAFLFGGDSSMAMCAYPAGPIDVLGGTGATYLILRGSRLLCRHAKLAGALIERLGRDTLVLFTVHIVESNILPWDDWVATFLQSVGVHPWDWVTLVACRLLLDVAVTVLIMRIPVMRRIFYPRR